MGFVWVGFGWMFVVCGGLGVGGWGPVPIAGLGIKVEYSLTQLFAMVDKSTNLLAESCLAKTCHHR